MVKLNEMNYEELTKHIADTLIELRRRAYGEGYEQGKFDQRMETAFDEVAKITDGFIPSKTGREFLEEQRKEEAADKEFYESHVNAYKAMTQEERDRIVERAKADVKELTRHNAETSRETKGIKYRIFAVKEQFKVNREKRTVVCLLKGVECSEVFGRGIAKCAPGDCFNVYIGKAIALRRALGLEVPDEYLNAPQPTEVRVGDVVEYEGYYGIRREKVEVDGKGERGKFHAKSKLAQTGRIIDDSREEAREETNEEESVC